MKRQMILLILTAILIMGLTACGEKASGSAEQEKQTTSQEQQSGKQTTAFLTESGTENTKEKEKQDTDQNVQQEQTVRRAGSSADTQQTPADFPDAYYYGSGRMSDATYRLMYQKMPEPMENDTVLHTDPDLSEIQVLYLWEKDRVPAWTRYEENKSGYYFDQPDFRPYMTAIPVREGVKPKGAVILLAGGAFAFRGNYTDSLPTAAKLRELGFLTFIVDYRLHPYTQEEGALDVARAVRYIRKHADVYGIDPNAIAVMGYSAGGIQTGEFFLHYDEEVNGSALDASYEPDELDQISAHASAAGMIYSFYGRLSVASKDKEDLKRGNLPPTFYVYGTRDPFFRQFEAQYDLMQEIGIPLRRIVLLDWPHGFGGDGGWIQDYADWLELIFSEAKTTS